MTSDLPVLYRRAFKELEKTQLTSSHRGAIWGIKLFLREFENLTHTYRREIEEVSKMAVYHVIDVGYDKEGDELDV